MREGSGGSVASSRAVQSEQAGWRWPGRVLARAGHALSSFWLEEDDDWRMAAWAGPLARLGKCAARYSALSLRFSI